jgi:hypothetical protein
MGGTDPTSGHLLDAKSGKFGVLATVDNGIRLNSGSITVR